MNIEFKAHCDDLRRAELLIGSLGGVLVRDHQESDTYFPTRTARLKLRRSDSRAPRLIAYERSDHQVERASNFEIADFSGGSAELTQKVLTDELGVGEEVVKHRKTYEGPGWLINLDTFRGHNFVELEVDAQLATVSASLDAAKSIREALGIRKIDILPQSYEQLNRILSEAESRRASLGERLRDLVLIDGPSGAGKSTLIGRLRKDLPAREFAFIRRCTSRSRREGDEITDEYEHMTNDEFQAQASNGAFVEYKDFLFGMSYGVRWDDVERSLKPNSVRRAYALVNLGNARHIREFVPEARLVLITAPIPDLKSRIEARGVHDPEALEERLMNAEMASERLDLYDHVVWNRNGAGEAAYEDLLRAIEGD